MGKKRKADVDMDLERGLYTSFVAAANSISQLYTQASAHTRQTRDAGARAALERVFNWAMREHGAQGTITTASLLEFLRQEIQNTESQTEIPLQAIPFPACVPPPTYTSGVQPSPAKRQETAFPQHGLEGQPGAFGGMTADMDECSESMNMRWLSASKSTSTASVMAVESKNTIHLPTYKSTNDFINRVCIYQGRLSTVWRCVCRKTHTPLALKQYHKPRMQAVHHEQVANEIAALKAFASASFSGVVHYYGTFEEGDSLFLVLEHCDGGSAFDRMRKTLQGGADEAWLAAKVVLPLLMTLDYAHRHHLVHRDIKPEHCLYTKAGAFRLADWGLALHLGPKGEPQPMPVVGTLDYLAPEVAVMSLRPGSLPTYGPKVDVWAVGILIWEALTGTPPFAVESQQQTAHNIQYAPLAAFPRHMSAACRDFVLKALCKHPDNRPSAAALIHHPWLLPHHPPHGITRPTPPHHTLTTIDPSPCINTQACLPATTITPMGITPRGHVSDGCEDAAEDTIAAVRGPLQHLVQHGHVDEYDSDRNDGGWGKGHSGGCEGLLNDGNGVGQGGDGGKGGGGGGWKGGLMPGRVSSSPNMLARNTVTTPPPVKSTSHTRPQVLAHVRLWTHQPSRGASLLTLEHAGASQPGSPLTPRRTATLWDSFRRLSLRWKAGGKGSLSQSAGASPRSRLGSRPPSSGSTCSSTDYDQRLGSHVGSHVIPPHAHATTTSSSSFSQPVCMGAGVGEVVGVRHASAPPEGADVAMLRGHAMITPLRAAPRSRAKAPRSRFAGGGGMAPSRSIGSLEEVATPLEQRFDAAVAGEG